MAPSLKEFGSSVLGRLVAGTLALGAGMAVAENAQAQEITTITDKVAKFCIGSSGGGIISGQVMGWEGVLTDGKSTGFKTTDAPKFEAQMDNPYGPGDYLAGVHRNFAYARWFANNGNVEGYYLYDISNLNGGSIGGIKNSGSFIINSKNYPAYQDGHIVHFIQGATPDQDRMVFLGDDVLVYKSPFDAAGKVKPECKTGPVVPDIIYKPKFPIWNIRANGNFIFTTAPNLDGGDGNDIMHKLIVGQSGITEDPATFIIKGGTSGWDPLDNGFVTMKDTNGIATTYLTIKGSDIVLVNITDINDCITINGAADMVTEDPAGRFAFKTKNVNGSNTYDVYITDTWVKPSVDKKIILDRDWLLQGLLSYAPDFPTPTWIYYGKGEATGKNGGLNDKAYLIELLDPATMEIKVTGGSFDTFKNNYMGGGEACVTVPGQVATVVKIGSPNPEPNPEPVVVEQNTVEQDKDAGSLDGGSDAIIDAWVDGKGDIGEIFTDAAMVPDVPDTTDTSDSGPDVVKDQSAPDADGAVDKDTGSDVSKDVSGDDVQIKPDVDATIAPPDMGGGDTNPIKEDAQGKEDTSVPGDDMSGGSDTVSSDGGPKAESDTIGSPMDGGKPGTGDNVSSSSSGCDSTTRASSKYPAGTAALVFLSALALAGATPQRRKRIMEVLGR